MAGEQNLIVDENLADYPPGNIIRATPTFTVVEGPANCGASNAERNKPVQNSN